MAFDVLRHRRAGGGGGEQEERAEQHRPPAEAIWAAQFFIGMTVGVKYTGITLAEVRRDLVAGAGYCGILLVLTFCFVEIVYMFGLAPGLEALLDRERICPRGR